MSDPFEAFQRRVDRRLAEQLKDAKSAFEGIVAELAGRYVVNSGPHLKRRLEEIEQRLQVGIDWTFGEVDRLPANKGMVWVVQQPFVEQTLVRFLYTLVDLAELWQPPPGGETANYVQSEIDRLRKGLAADLEEFGAGLWTPRPAPAGFATGPVTFNAVHVNAPVHGPIQQAGSHSSQTATVTVQVADVEVALNNLVASLERLNLAERDKAELEADAATVRAQLRKQAPDSRILQFAVQSLVALVLGVTGNLVTPEVQYLLAAVGLNVLA